ncbi:hypothetical protein Btru_063817 [Bulinus truncatus]|nr:hypothetical protein Btru_063817 [Bulinus truncatus]
MGDNQKSASKTSSKGEQKPRKSTILVTKLINAIQALADEKVLERILQNLQVSKDAKTGFRVLRQLSNAVKNNVIPISIAADINKWISGIAKGLPLNKRSEFQGKKCSKRSKSRSRKKCVCKSRSKGKRSRSQVKRNRSKVKRSKSKEKDKRSRSKSKRIGVKRSKGKGKRSKRIGVKRSKGKGKKSKSRVVKRSKGKGKRSQSRGVKRSKGPQ